MKAVLHTAYGPPDELQLQEVEKPRPAENEILIKIQAATVTSTDCNVRNFTFVPKVFHLPMRLNFGLFKPKNNRIGFDLSGEVESIGENVTRFDVGDQVFGTTEPAYGAHAEYICLPEDAVLAKKPATMSYQEAATVPVIGNTALFYIRDLGNIQPGQKILINGASGGIGTFAVQLAKYYGAEVTGVCSTGNLDLVRSLGADQVIDYTKEDLNKSAETYDVIFDVAGKLVYSETKHLLKENGKYLLTVPTLESLLNSRNIKVEGAPPNLDNLLFLRERIEAGDLKTVISQRYTLEQVADAFRYVESGHKTGHVVITVV